MIAVRLAEASFTRGRGAVLSNIDLAIPQGAFVGVFGPNGAGKTTLLRAILGLLRPTTGTVEVLGRPAMRGNPAIGVVPQSHDGLAGLRLSGRAFVAAASGIGWGLPRLTASQHHGVDRVLHLVDAAGYAHRPVCTLSGGERQRLMLAQALLGTPRLLLLDEPLAGLDPQAQAATVRLVGDLQRRLGITVLFTAHDLNVLLPALDLVLYLGGGRAALGSVDQVVTAPNLSRLYGTPVDVIRAQGHIFVVAGATRVLWHGTARPEAAQAGQGAHVCL